MIANHQIQQLTSVLVNLTKPTKVILFGSYANGKAADNSDVDLLVIVSESKISLAERNKTVRQQLWNYQFNFPKDILVYTQHEVDEWKNVPQAFISTAIREGKVLYENQK